MQARTRAQGESQAQQKEDQCQVRPNPVEEQCPFSALDDELFQTSRTRQTLTRKEKRDVRRRHGLIRAKDDPKRTEQQIGGVDVDKVTTADAGDGPDSEGRTRDG